jgi:hypothetical protein
MSTESTTSRAYKALVDELQAKWEAGDELAARCLSAMSLLAAGWRYGDPDPLDPDDDPGGGENVVDLESYRTRLVA